MDSRLGGNDKQGEVAGMIRTSESLMEAEAYKAEQFLRRSAYVCLEVMK